MIKFGTKLRTAFARISDTKDQGKERQRIFMKVKEKLDEETSKVQALKNQMTENKEKINRDLQKEQEEIVKKRELDEQKRKADFEAQKILDEQQRAKNDLMD